MTSLVACGIVKGDSLVAACCVTTLSTVHACAIGQLTVTTFSAYVYRTAQGPCFRETELGTTESTHT